MSVEEWSPLNKIREQVSKVHRHTLAQAKICRAVAVWHYSSFAFFFLGRVSVPVNPISIVSWKRLEENLLVGAYKGQ